MKIVNETERETESIVTVRFQDCDPFGHLNNARYIDYFTNAREDQLIRYYDFDIYKLGKDGRNLKSFLWTEFRYISLATGKSVPYSNELMDFLGRIQLREDGLEGRDYEARARSLAARFNLPAA
ncbi:MAG TPA: thioesterase family protein [Fibrobacteria bacterium]|nr:thioesterase family protein [Fibrobacteria bacterium]